MKRSLLIISLGAVMASAGAFSRVDRRLESSAIYPGTTHDYIVTVGDAYTPGQPAALYIGLDGILCDAPAVLDTLTAAGEVPPMIGIFLQPGVVTDSEGNVRRYNRSNEFDAIDERFARFLETELLPAVDGMTMPDGRRIELPTRPENRVIMGLSSGGIAAFNATFRRPDLIGKVFSGCGTFVPMRGGEQLQALVRKTEPAAVRVYLQDGYRDTWNPLFGSWFEANTLLNSALEFAGYDVAHDWADGVHSVRRATEIFPEVMRWMWRDYPSSVATPTSGNSTLKEYLIAGEAWQAAPAETPGAGRTEAVYPDSTLIASTMPGSSRLSQTIIDANGQRAFTQPFYYLHTLTGDAATVRDLTFDSLGNLWVLTPEGIQICDQNGRVRAILRLPVNFNPATLAIDNGRVTLTGTDSRVFTRRMHVAPAIPGVTPPSQGAA